MLRRVQAAFWEHSLDNDLAFLSSEAAEKHGLTEPERVLGALECQEYAVHPGVDENSQTNGIADDRQSLSSADNLVCMSLRILHPTSPMDTLPFARF